MANMSSKNASLEIWLEQYKTVREEINNSIRNQQTTLQWTSVSVAGILLLAYYLFTSGYEKLTFAVLLVFIPCTAIMYLNIWIGEIAHMMQGSDFLFNVEEKLAVYLEDSNSFPLFEHWLRNGSKYVMTGYISSVAIYMGLLAVGHIMSNVMIYQNGNIIPEGHYGWKISFTLLTILFNVCININRYRLIKKYVLKPATSIKTVS